MPRTPTQRATGVTRFRGPVNVTLAGAGGQGHSYTYGGVPGNVSLIDPALVVAVPVGQTANSIEIQSPEGTVIGAYSASSTPLTSAQILTLNTNPVPLLPAPGAGKAIVVTGFIFDFAYTAPQYTGGGAVNPVYHGQTTNLLAASVAAATILAAASSVTSVAVAANSVTVLPNTGVDLYAATGNFAAGAGTATVLLEYMIINV